MLGCLPELQYMFKTWSVVDQLLFVLFFSSFIFIFIVVVL